MESLAVDLWAAAFGIPLVKAGAATDAVHLHTSVRT